MKSIKILFAFAIAALFFAVPFADVEGISEESSANGIDIGGYTYELDKSGTATCIGFASGQEKSAVDIPDTVSDGRTTYAVREIAPSAFSGKSLTSITLGMNVSQVGQNCFEANPNVFAITFTGKECKLATGSFDLGNPTENAASINVVSPMKWAIERFNAPVIGSTSSERFVFVSSDPDFVDVMTGDSIDYFPVENVIWDESQETATLALNGAKLKYISIKSDKPVVVKLNGKNTVDSVAPQQHGAVVISCNQSVTITGKSLDINFMADDDGHGLRIQDPGSQGNATIEGAEISIRTSDSSIESIRDHRNLGIYIGKPATIRNSEITLSNVSFGINLPQNGDALKITESAIDMENPAFEGLYTFIQAVGGITCDAEPTGGNVIKFYDGEAQETAWKSGLVHLIKIDSTGQIGTSDPEPGGSHGNGDISMIAVLGIVLVLAVLFGCIKYPKK